MDFKKMVVSINSFWSKIIIILLIVFILVISFSKILLQPEAIYSPEFSTSSDYNIELAGKELKIIENGGGKAEIEIFVDDARVNLK